MFNSLSLQLSKTVKHLRGQARLTEDNIKDTLREIRISLLEADVSLPVTKQLITDIKQEAVGTEVSAALNPGQALVKIVKHKLTELMTAGDNTLNLKAQPPVVIMLVGLQGTGKTTSAAKLAKYLIEKNKKKVMLASVDIYRPAAIEQLKTLAKECNIECFDTDPKLNPTTSARLAIERAKQQYQDILIIDTAGRQSIDTEMMNELLQLQQQLNPTETLFIADSMLGQSAATTAQQFQNTIELTGIILTKADGDARGGAALSVSQITGKPIKFIGMGEKTEAISVFHPERIASQILGMGDLVSVIEELEQQSKQQPQAHSKANKNRKSFTLQDFADQLVQLNKMGGLTKLLNKLPGVNDVSPQQMNAIKQASQTKMTLAIIRSMTPKERQYPDLIKASRKRRIAAGSGTQVQDINRLLKQFLQMQKMMKKVSKNPAKMQQMMRNLPMQ